MTESADGMWSGANALAASSCRRTSSLMRQWRRSLGPPCTIRCPIATRAGILESSRSLAIRMIASRWLGIGEVSESNILLRESRATNLPSLSPIDSASPERRISVQADPTRYNPNLSDDEPLFSARMGNARSASVMSRRVKRSNSQAPAPIAHLWHVLTMLADIELVTFHHGPIALARLLHLIDQPRDAPDGVKGKLVAVEVVKHYHVERRGRGSFFHVTAHMDVVVILPPVGKPMDNPRVPMEGEYHGLVASEELVEIPVLKSVWMLRLRLQRHEIDHVDDADANIRHVLAQQCHRSECLERRHIAGARHDHIGVARIIARPRPDTYPRSAMTSGRIDIEPLPFQLLAGDDQVHVIPASETVIGHGQQAIGVRRQIDPNDLGAFIRNMIDEARILMGKSIMILPPHQRGQQIVERSDRFPPRNVPGRLQPLGVLIEHRVDDMGEGLVAGEQAMTPGEQVTFKPALAHVLTQHFHDTAGGAEVNVNVFNPGHPLLGTGFVDSVETVRGRLVWPE